MKNQCFLHPENLKKFLEKTDLFNFGKIDLSLVFAYHVVIFFKLLQQVKEQCEIIIENYPCMLTICQNLVKAKLDV